MLQELKEDIRRFPRVVYRPGDMFIMTAVLVWTFGISVGLWMISKYLLLVFVVTSTPFQRGVIGAFINRRGGNFSIADGISILATSLACPAIAQIALRENVNETMLVIVLLVTLYDDLLNSLMRNDTKYVESDKTEKAKIYFGILLANCKIISLLLLTATFFAFMNIFIMFGVWPFILLVSFMGAAILNALNNQYERFSDLAFAGTLSHGPHTKFNDIKLLLDKDKEE
ncbi:MAG: hypothetical protein Q7S19_03350 [bacterium]|nr:hypothetical protein [bacterium]